MSLRFFVPFHVFFPSMNDILPGSIDALNIYGEWGAAVISQAYG
jgi:hypothetical protein